MNLRNNMLSNNINELGQAYKSAQTTLTADGVIEIQYDDEIERLIFETSPTYGYLKPRIESKAHSSKVGYRTKERKTNASFIGEVDNIPEHDPSIFRRQSQVMSILTYPIEISDLAELGAEDNIDLKQDEINDGIVDINMRKDYAILHGDNEKDPTTFDGFTTLFTTNVTDLKKAQITLEDLDLLAQNIIDNGGTPTAVFTTAAVSRRLKELINAKLRYDYSFAQRIGFNAVGYVTPAGNEIPIIIDKNIEPSENGHQLIMVDEKTLRIKELLAPTVELMARTKLTTSLVIKNFTTMYCRSEHKNGYLYNINPNVE